MSPEAVEPSLSLPELLDRIQNGDDEALLMLHERYINVVYSVAYRVLEQSQDAEEVAQDVFMRIWKKSNAYNPQKGRFVTWLLAITRNLAIDHLRKRQRREPKQPVISMDAQPQLWEVTLLQEDMSDVQRNLLSALRQLPSEQQKVLQLAYFYQMSHSDIAAYLEQPLGTVKTHIRQGMQRLRAIWLETSGVV